MKILFTVEPAQTDDLDEPLEYRCSACGAEADGDSLADHALDVHQSIFFETEWDDIEITDDDDSYDDLFTN